LVTEASIIQGRRIGASELDQVRNLLASHPDWSRRRLSQELATLWNWRNGAGQLKDMAARTLMLKLEQRGWIGLPLRRVIPGNRMRHKRLPEPSLAAPVRLRGRLHGGVKVPVRPKYHRPVTEGYCVVATRGGELPEVNCQSVTKYHRR
jgi:hypothetical protein